MAEKERKRKGRKERNRNKPQDELQTSHRILEEDMHHPGIEEPEDEFERETEKFASVIEDEIANNLFHQRAQFREGALEKIAQSLRRSVLRSFILTQKEHLLKALDSGLSHGNAKEQILACDVICMFCVTVAGAGLELYEHFKSKVARLLSSSSNYDVRAACVLCLGILCFVWAQEEAQTVECVEQLSKILLQAQQPENSEENEAATNSKEVANFLRKTIDMWCFLCTTLDNSLVVDELIPNDCANIVAHLYSYDIDLRLAAGQALAFMAVQIAQNIENDENNDRDEYTAYTFSSYFDVSEVQELLHRDGQALPTSGTSLSLSSAGIQKKATKKERATQRHGFGNILASFEEGAEGPPHPSTFTIKHQQFSFYSWSEIKQLEAFREVLQEGFQLHLQENPLLAQIFDIELVADVPKMTKLEKRQYLSSNSSVAKARSRHRTAGRATKFSRAQDF